MADGSFGFLPVGGSSGIYNAQSFVIMQHMRRINTTTLVEIIAVTNDGGISPSGYVDVRPLVDLVDGDNNRISHNTIFKCPYMRIQGGTNAIIIDPQVGDMGIVSFADRDISKVIATLAAAAPGSARRFSMADALYLYSIPLGVAPTQYVQFNSDGITIHSPTTVTLDAPDVKIQCETLEINATSSASITTPTLTVNGNVTSTGTVQAPNVSATTQLLAVGKDVGPNHTHAHGTMTATGITGTVN